jgi:hypothetical protein
MDIKDYIRKLLLILKTSEIPIDEINFKVGFLRLQNIYYYEPCLQFVREKFLRKKQNT